MPDGQRAEAHLGGRGPPGSGSDPTAGLPPRPAAAPSPMSLFCRPAGAQGRCLCSRGIASHVSSQPRLAEA